MACNFRIFANLRAAGGGLLFGLLLAPLAAALPGGVNQRYDGAAPELQRLIVAEARATGVVPAALALAVAKEASDFNHRVVSATGGIGVLQIPPGTAAREYGLSADQLWDPVANVRVGLHYLSRLFWLYGGDWELALSHFRGGALPWHAGRYWPHDYTRAYVERVLRWWQFYRSDPLVQVQTRRFHLMPQFAEPFAAYEFPRFTVDPPRFTTDLPMRYRSRNRWIPLTGSGRFQ